MSKKHEREDRLIDRQQREIRELKSLNKSLLRRIKKLSKGYQAYFDREEEAQGEVVEDAVKEAKKVCFECGAEFKEIIIGNRRFRKCQNQNCGKQGKVSIIEK